MSLMVDEEQILKTAVELLSSLVISSEKGNDQNYIAAINFDDVLSSRLSSPTFSDSYNQLIQLMSYNQKPSWPICNTKSPGRWKFICTCLQLMKMIRDIFIKTTDERVKLLSISQKKILEAAVEFVVSLGILHNLLPGVGVSLDCRNKLIHKIPRENLSEFTKYKRLCYVLNDIRLLFEADVFHDLIILKHLDDILAALFQLSFAPLKKPTGNKNLDPFVNFEILDDDFEINDMTFVIWKKLVENQQKYADYLQNLMEKIYQPLLIRKFSILLNVKGVPRWMKQKLTRFLVDIVKKENGVVVTIKALLDGESTNSKLTFSVPIAKFISHECSKDVSHIAPQLLKILKSENKKPHDRVFLQIAALTISYMFFNDSKFAEKYIFDEMRKPFKFVESATEGTLADAIYQLYNSCVLPLNDEFVVPDSVCYLRSYVKEILSIFLLKLEDNLFPSVMDCLIFNAESNEIFRMPANKDFSLSASGGVDVVDSEDDVLQLESAVILLNLIKNISENELVVRALFIYLLKTFIDVSLDEENAQKRLIIVILLTELSQDANTLKYILKDSENIINFVAQILCTNVDATRRDDIICVCLTFLTLVLYDVKKKNISWNIFNDLLSVVDKFRQNSTTEVKFLAEEVHNLIVSRGLIGKLDKSEERKDLLIKEINRSKCEHYIEEACDSLLPVRAHALMELISLLKKGDTEAIAKKEKIYCLFQENLKDQDGFLYLRAIEGLACMASLKPNVILPLLCQEFSSCSSSTMRLKIGEVLMRTIAKLNDFVHPFKRLLISTFLKGVKSEDSLIRASSLSNLAELCMMLEHDIEDVLYEVLSCALNVAQFDTDLEPRRAGVLLVSGLFCGLKTSIFTTLESHLLEIYQTLKRLYETGEDETVQMQAMQALKILSSNVRQFLSPKLTFEKKIHVGRPL